MVLRINRDLGTKRCGEHFRRRQQLRHRNELVQLQIYVKYIFRLIAQNFQNAAFTYHIGKTDGQRQIK